jgi:hypothetical protein
MATSPRSLRPLRTISSSRTSRKRWPATTASAGSNRTDSSFTQSGKNYVVSGYLAHNPGIADGRVAVYVSHGFWTEDLFYVLDSWGYTTPASMEWRRFSFTFKAPAAQTTLWFQDVSGLNDFQGVALDGLKVTPSN